MDVLCIHKNDIHQLTVEIIPSVSVSFSLNWFGNTNKEIAIGVTRADDFGIHRWNALRVMVGDKISFITTEANKVDNPIEFVTAEELVTLARSKPKMEPGKRVTSPLREIGDLYCQINNMHLFSFRLDTDHFLSVEFVWLGGRTGTSLMHIGSEVSPKPKIPTIAFGDEVTFRTTAF